MISHPIQRWNQMVVYLLDYTLVLRNFSFLCFEAMHLARNIVMVDSGTICIFNRTRPCISCLLVILVNSCWVGGTIKCVSSSFFIEVSFGNASVQDTALAVLKLAALTFCFKTHVRVTCLIYKNFVD